MFLTKEQPTISRKQAVTLEELRRLIDAIPSRATAGHSVLNALLDYYGVAGNAHGNVAITGVVQAMLRGQWETVELIAKGMRR